MQVSKDEFLEYATPRLNSIYDMDFNNDGGGMEKQAVGPIKDFFLALRSFGSTAGKTARNFRTASQQSGVLNKGKAFIGETVNSYKQNYSRLYKRQLLNELRASQAGGHVIDAVSKANKLSTLRKANARYINGNSYIRPVRPVMGPQLPPNPEGVELPKQWYKRHGNQEKVKEIVNSKPPTAEAQEKSRKLQNAVTRSGMPLMLTAAGFGGTLGLGGYYLGRASGRKDADELYSPALQELIRRNYMMQQNNQDIFNRMGNVFTGNVTNIQ